MMTVGNLETCTTPPLEAGFTQNPYRMGKGMGGRPGACGHGPHTGAPPLDTVAINCSEGERGGARGHSP